MAHSRVERVGLELDAARLEFGARGLDVVDASSIGWLLDRNSMPNNEPTDLRLYSPLYLSRPQTRPRITAAPAEIGFGEEISIEYDNGPAHRVTLLAPGAMTPCFDQNQRLLELFEGSSSDGEVTVEAPADAFAAPPGDYLLFVLRRVDTEAGLIDAPSVAAVVSLVDEGDA